MTSISQNTTTAMETIPSDNYESDYLFEPTLQSFEENHVCDMSLMTIDETSCLQDTIEPNESTNKINTTDELMEIEATKEHVKLNNSSHLYLNDLEVARNNEEQETITELVRASSEHSLIERNQYHSMRVAFGVILRLVLPLANGVARTITGIRDVRFLNILQRIASSRRALTSLVAFAANSISMNLSAVQVSHRIDPILKLLKIRKSRDGIESLPDTLSVTSSTPSTPSTPSTSCMSLECHSPVPMIHEPSFLTYAGVKRKSQPEEPASNCCSLNILAEPPPGVPIRADIIFIHGLHGSLVNTWKQGLWEKERKPVEFQRPPKPPVRPPKRARHSRSTVLQPPHEQKRARISELDKQSSEVSQEEMTKQCNLESDFSYFCDAPQNIQICDGVEYSFPTLRVRTNDNGRLLQAELESIINDENAFNEFQTEQQELPQFEDTAGNANNNKSKKPSADDPNYSKCWPGDWLPLDCPGVRVIALNYTTDPYLWRPLWKKKESRTNLIRRAREMAELLVRERVGYGHPIVWVGHSKGGLFVKQIIVDAWESGRPAVAPFWRSSRGVFFYSVPHRGSHLANIKAPLLARSVELLDIEKNNKYLLDLHRRFLGLYHLGHLKIEVFSFVEMSLTLMSVLYLRIVGVDSADPGIGDVCGIRLDHREICKPRSRECILYKELIKMIKKVC